MNNKFNYDQNNKPKKILSCRKLSNGDYYINGRIVNSADMTTEEKAAAKVFDNLHAANLDKDVSDSSRKAAFKAFSAFKKHQLKNNNL